MISRSCHAHPSLFTRSHSACISLNPSRPSLLLSILFILPCVHPAWPKRGHRRDFLLGISVPLRSQIFFRAFIFSAACLCRCLAACVRDARVAMRRAWVRGCARVCSKLASSDRGSRERITRLHSRGNDRSLLSHTEGDSTNSGNPPLLEESYSTLRADNAYRGIRATVSREGRFFSQFQLPSSA